MPEQNHNHRRTPSHEPMPAGYREKTRPRVLAYYVAGLFWCLYAVILPLYRWTDYLIAGLLTGGVFALTMFLTPKKVVRIPLPAAKPLPPSDDGLPDNARELLRGLRQADEAIQNEQVSLKIRVLENRTCRIFQVIQEHPEKQPEIRRFVQYYLPTLLKLLRTYDQMEEQGVRGEHIDASMAGIERLLSTAIAAFDKQLDNLFGSEAMDISTDITVLEQLMEQEGLTGSSPGKPQAYPSDTWDNQPDN